MKTAFVALMMLVSTATTIASAGETYKIHPKVGGYSVTELCDAGETFRTKLPVKKCKDWRSKDVVYDQVMGKEWECAREEVGFQIVSKNYFPKKCDHTSPPDCLDTPERYDNTFQVPVYEDHIEYGRTHVANTSYTVPACK